MGQVPDNLPRKYKQMAFCIAISNQLCNDSFTRYIKNPKPPTKQPTSQPTNKHNATNYPNPSLPRRLLRKQRKLDHPRFRLGPTMCHCVKYTHKLENLADLSKTSLTKHPDFTIPCVSSNFHSIHYPFLPQILQFFFPGSQARSPSQGLAQTYIYTTLPTLLFYTRLYYTTFCTYSNAISNQI